MPLLILAGKEYGSGSSRDWAAKGPMLLGVRAVIAESYERIHRSNLVGMGVLPLQFKPGETAESLGPDRRGSLRHRRAGRGARQGFRPGQTDHRAGAQGRRQRARRSRRWCASIRRRRCFTTSMAAFCSMCCGNCWLTGNPHGN